MWSPTLESKRLIFDILFDYGHHLYLSFPILHLPRHLITPPCNAHTHTALYVLGVLPSCCCCVLFLVPHRITTPSISPHPGVSPYHHPKQKSYHVHFSHLHQRGRERPTNSVPGSSAKMHPGSRPLQRPADRAGICQADPDIAQESHCVGRSASAQPASGVRGEDNQTCQERSACQ